MKKVLTWLGLQPINRNEAQYLYKDYIGKEVVVFYRDVYGTSRKMVGIINKIDHNIIHLRSNITSWSGIINCDVCSVGNICTKEGWGRLITEMETK
jgi:hypothetical protein